MNEIQALLSQKEIIKDFDLDNIKKLLLKLGNPEDGIKYVHVAGTNGKGSVCAMIATALSGAGYKAGLYTSPHLDRLNERIRIDGKMISDKELNRILKRIRRTAEKNRIKTSFFESMTAAAFLYFCEKKVDYAVLETGMGGRLDATNVITPEVAVITNISLDHTMHLGNTISKIAFEKAGIIKKNSVLISGASGDALKVIRTECRKKKAKLIIPKIKKVDLSLRGGFQQENAALAISALKQLGISDEIIKRALKKTVWPGRLEFLQPNLIIDGAHNPGAFEMLAKELKELKRRIKYKRLILVVGIMKDKDIKGISLKINQFADEIILTKPSINSKRAADTNYLAEFFNHKKKTVQINDLRNALSYAKNNSGKNDLILVTGSLFTMAEARMILKK